MSSSSRVKKINGEIDEKNIGWRSDLVVPLVIMNELNRVGTLMTSTSVLVVLAPPTHVRRSIVWLLNKTKQLTHATKEKKTKQITKTIFTKITQINLKMYQQQHPKQKVKKEKFREQHEISSTHRDFVFPFSATFRSNW